jgi:hypothetical protein
MASATIGSLRVNLGIDSAELSTGFKKAGGEANTFAGKLKGVFAGVQKQSGVAGKAVGALGGAFVKLAGIVTGIVASAFAALSLKNFLQASIENERVQAQLGATLKSTGEAAGRTRQQLNEMATSLQKVTTFGDEAINGAQALLLTFTKIRGDVFDDATRAILDVSTAMKVDLRSATIQVGKALNDPVKGMTALARSGITFTESQKAMVKQMVATGDVVGAQRLILKELETQFGGSARAARETLGGALQSLRNAWGDLFELPRSATEGLRTAIEALIVAIQDPAFIAFVQTIGVMLVNAFKLAINGLTLLVNGINLVVANIDTIGVAALTAGTMLGIAFGPAIIGAIISSFALLAQAGVAAITAITAAMARNPFGALAVGITIAITALYHFRDQAQQAVGVDVIGIIQQAANYIVNSFRAAFQDIVFVWNNLPTIVGAAAIGAVNAVIAAIERMLNNAIGMLNDFIRQVNAALSMVPGGLEIGTVGSVSMGRVDNSFAAKLAAPLEAHNAKIQEIMASDPIGQLGSMFSTTTPEIEDFSGALGALNNDLDELGAEGGGKKGGGGKAAKAAKAIKDVGKAAKEAADEAAKAAKAITDFLAGLTKTFVADLRQGLEQGKGFWKSFRDAALNALDAIATKLINLGIDQMFAGLSSGAGGGLFGKLFAGFFAGGGTIPRGQYGIVGEAGAELVEGPANVTPLERINQRDLVGGMAPHVDVNLRSVNVFDPADMLERALGTRAGERVLLNFVNQNSGAMRGALGGAG